MSCMKLGDVRPPDHRPARDPGQARNPERSPKRRDVSFVTTVVKAVDSMKNAARPKPPQPSLRPSNGAHYSGALQGIKLPPIEDSEAPRNQPASSSSSSRQRDDDAYHFRPPPPGSYQDDDTGPSPKNLVMAVNGVKGAVGHFAKAVMADMSKYPGELAHLEERIRQEVHPDVDRPNHWKFLVQSFISQRMFVGFQSENGFFGVKYFDKFRMTTLNSFVDFSKFKDKAATIATLLAQDSPDKSFLGKYCFQKFKSLTLDPVTQRPFALYKDEWEWVQAERHARTGFYQSFLKVAVSVWLLHRLVHSFEQGWMMLGWETVLPGSRFLKASMESVVPGALDDDDDDDETGADSIPVVAFLVLPGFQVSQSIVKSEVYVRNLTTTESPSLDHTPSLDKRPILRDKRPAYYRTPSGSFRSSSTYSGGAEVEGARKYWESSRTRERSDLSKEWSPKVGSGRRLRTSSHYLPTQTQTASSPHPKSTKTSRIREEQANKRKEEGRRNGWTM